MDVTGTVGKRPKGAARVPQQSRSEDAIAKIAEGVVSLLASGGHGALTHRRVAEAAGVSLATTTYYYASKFELIAHAQSKFLAEYDLSFVHAKERHRSGEAPITDLADLMVKAMKNAVARHRRDTLAWSEIMLDCSREPRGHALAREWFGRMEKIWGDLLREIGTADAATLVNPAIDTVMGIGFITIPLQLTVEHIDMLVVAGRPLAEICGDLPNWAVEREPEPGYGSSKSRGTRERIIAAGVALLEAGAASTISYSTVAQRAGLTSAAPSYHFPTMEQLLVCVQHEILHRMRTRNADMRAGIGEADAGTSAADLLAAVYMRSVITDGAANVAGIQVWLDAARNPDMRAQVTETILTFEKEFQCFLARFDLPSSPRMSLILMAQFIGKYIRASATGSTTGYLARARQDFDRSLASTNGESPLVPSGTAAPMHRPREFNSQG